jgi:hypothetical protein
LKVKNSLARKNLVTPSPPLAPEGEGVRHLVDRRPTLVSVWLLYYYRGAEVCFEESKGQLVTPMVNWKT